MTALVTGSAGGIGSAIVSKLRAEGFEVQELDLVNGFDVSDPEAWEHVGSVDLACLNAGVVTGENGDIATLTDGQYRRALGVNVDGVVFGVRRLDRVMPKGSTIVVTASLAGLTAIPDDPIYGLTKHAVVGFVRSVAAQLADARDPDPGRLPRLGGHGADDERLPGRPPRARLPPARARRPWPRACGPPTRARARARRGSSSPAASRCSTSSRACPGRAEAYRCVVDENTAYGATRRNPIARYIDSAIADD